MLNNIMTRFGVLFVVFSMILITGFIFFSDAVTSSSQSALSQSSKAAPQAVTQQDYPAAQDAPVIKLASLSVDLGETPDEAIGGAIAIPEAAPSDTASILTRAMSFAEAKKFDDALRLLGTVHAVDKDSYRVQFLEAKLLSWAGRHQEAEAVFVTLNDAYPQNSDVMVSHAYLKMYQEDYAQAEVLFSDVLSKHPDYEDARRGLNMVRYAK